MRAKSLSIQNLLNLDKTRQLNLSGTGFLSGRQFAKVYFQHSI